MDRIESFGSSADIAHILSSYCLAGKYVFNLIGRILGFGFSAQIERKKRSFKEKAATQKEDQKLEKALSF